MYGQRQYKQARAQTASPGDLVVMLYDGVARFCEAAIAAAAAGDRSAVATATSRALAIVDYLQTILNPEPHPDLVAHLDGLYGYWTRQIARCNSTLSGAPVEEILPQVLLLRDTWQEAQTEVARQNLLRQP